MLNIVYFTRPEFFDHEAEQIVAHFEKGLQILHLRKPDTSAAEYETLLRQIPEVYHERITLHDHFELADRFAIGGVHLNRRNPTYSGARRLRISKSCHSIDELRNISEFDYVTLSPIFNSISKAGYNSAFSHEDLLHYSKIGLINEKVYALGGVNFENMHKLEQYDFGGCAMLGAVWSK
jgi:thiamine-phosphate pyrophosphorylase